MNTSWKSYTCLTTNLGVVFGFLLQVPVSELSTEFWKYHLDLLTFTLMLPKVEIKTWTHFMGLIHDSDHYNHL